MEGVFILQDVPWKAYLIEMFHIDVSVVHIFVILHS